MQALRSCLRVQNSVKLLKNCARFSHVGSSKLFVNKIVLKNCPASGVSVYKLSTVSEDSVDVATFEKACEETLESLTDYFETIVEQSENLMSGDVSYSSGVLTANLGPRYGTYVINRQSPNKQIWLSSPVSGPKRYDFLIKDNCWVYKHDGQSLHELLQKEISKIVNFDVDFGSCEYSRIGK